MGHLIHTYLIKDAKDDKDALKKAYAEAEEYAYYNGDREEGTDSYYNHIELVHIPEFNNRADAESYIDEKYSGTYNDCLLKVLADDSAQPKKIQVLRKRLEDAQANYKKLANDFTDEFYNTTSKTVGCKECNKRIVKSEIKRLNTKVDIPKCPHCKASLLSRTYNSRLRSALEKITEYQARLDTEMRSNKKVKYWYLGKCEIHT